MTVIMFKKIGIVILIITITDDLKRKKAPIDLYFDNLGGLAMPPPPKSIRSFWKESSLFCRNLIYSHLAVYILSETLALYFGLSVA